MDCLDVHLLYNCVSSGDKDGSIIPWSSKYDETLSRHIANVRKDPKYFLTSDGVELFTSTAYDNFDKNPPQLRQVLAMAVYGLIKDQHGGIEILDAESPSTQPRITKFFKKKRRTKKERR